jgi:ABC-type transport system involved in multi-copper enzyme maturation permease subunit
MLWLIAKKEYLLNLISMRFVIAFALASTLTLLSVYIMAGEYQDRLKEYGQRVASHVEQLRSAYSYDDLLDDEIVVDKEPAKLGVFVQGIEPSISPVVKSRKGEYPVLSESRSDNLLLSLFRRIDFLFVVQYVMSLMALFFAYDSITGEKATGTLKLLFSNPVRRETVLLGKVIGGYACLVTPLVFAFVAGLILIEIRGVGFSGEDWIRAGAILAVSLVFILCIYMLGILVSCTTRSSVTSLFVLLFIWTVFAFNIPPLSHLAAKQLHRAPEHSTVLASTVDIRQEVNRRFMERTFDYTTQNEEAPTLDVIYSFIREEKEKGDQKLKRVLESREAELRQQIELAVRMSRLSPLASFASCAMQLANTGLGDQYSFADSVRRYQNTLFEYVGRIEKKNRPVNAAELPLYRHQRVKLEASLAGAATDAGVLALFTTLFFAAAYWAFLRYDLR